MEISRRTTGIPIGNRLKWLQDVALVEVDDLCGLVFLNLISFSETRVFDGYLEDCET